ncbi:MAG: OmpA family protein [Alphaproteobacteria bacterium]|nr:OmpA family protein [Alphaproteobacteria bacterium]MBV8407481.1 OmpA family protein [Alphaproteobacteria bacterium]
MKAAVAALAAFLPFAAHAQSWFTPGPTSSGFYIGIQSGTTWFLANNGYQMNTGWTSGAFVGYEFPFGIRAEFEGSYSSYTGTGPGRVPTLVDTVTPTTQTTTTPSTTVTTTTPPQTIPGTVTCTQPNPSAPPICVTGPPTIIPGTTTTTVIPGTTSTFTTNNTTTTQTTVPGTVSGTIQQMTYLASGYIDLLPGARIVPYVGAGLGMAFISDGVASCGICSTQFAYQSTVGVGYNVNDNIRIDFETRYYGTTSPGTYNNNNITTTVRARYKLNQRRNDQQQRQEDPEMHVYRSTLMVFFDWDSANLSPQALGTVQRAADLFKANGNARITATGHTDTSGPESYNVALSLRRANVVKDALVRDGVPAQAIVVVGKGESQLLSPTGDGVREPQNRRVEIVTQ